MRRHRDDSSKTSDTDGIPARKLGKLNSFLHASPSALVHAWPNSAVAKISKVYAGLLGSHLPPEAGTTRPTLQEVAATLSSAANKPLSPGVIAAVNAKLGSVNPALATSINFYPGALRVWQLLSMVHSDIGLSHPRLSSDCKEGA